MDGLDQTVAYFKTREEAEKLASDCRLRQKVKTDVFRVNEKDGLFYVEQDLS